MTDTLPSGDGTQSTGWPGPTRESERIQVLDVLRGVALLGILITNIQHFSMVAGAVRNPTLFGDLTGANFWVYAATFNLALQKFLPIFSMLFGAGILLMADRREGLGENPARLHYRRMAVLLLIALVHAYLIWYGDILFAYAVSGAFVYSLRRRPPGFLFTLGIVMLVAFPVMRFLIIAAPALIPYWDFFPGMTMEEIIAADVTAFQGGWAENFQMRARYALEDQTLGLLIHNFWKAAGLMLIGMGLYRTGVITGRAKASTYRVMVAVGLGVGLPITGWVFWLSHSTGWNNFMVRELMLQVVHWVGVAMSLGWMGIVMLACRGGCDSWLGRSLAAVGRTALSNYLLQSILCTFIFYGFGLGLYGSVERVGQLAIVLGVWGLQLVISPLWLKHFRFGPAEWVWRALSYGRRPPFRVTGAV
jgi:uncharacterized protein